MFKFNKKALLLIGLLIVMALGLTACNEKKEGILAEVNGHEIGEEDFNQEFESLKNMYKKELGEAIMSQEVEDGKTYEEVLWDNLLESMILEKLIGAEMEELNIMIEEEDIDKEIEERYIDGLGGEEEYKKFLESNNFTEEFLRSSLRKSLMDDRYRENYFESLDLTDQEIEKYFESNKEGLVQVRARIIQVEKRDDGEKILERLKKNEDFQDLATTESIDTISAAHGGDIGYFSKGTLGQLPEIEAEAFKLEVGEISDIVESDGGYYIIMLEDKKEKLEDLKEEIVPLVKNERYIDKLSQLKDRADIKIY